MTSLTKLAIGGFCLAALLTGSACQKNLSTQVADRHNTPFLSTADPAALIAYKQSKHELMIGFYRTYGGHYGSITSLPDSLDIIDIFGSLSDKHFGDSLKNYFVPSLHAKGTRVTLTGDLTIPAGVTHDSAGYAITAKRIVDTLNKYGLDGFDIDIESNPSGSDLTDKAGVYMALSKYLGPKSGTGKLLTFDTNQSGSNSLFRKVYSVVSYVLLQSYGRGTLSMQSTWNSFSPYISASQFIPSFSFYEENGYPGNIWYDITYPENHTGNAYDIARWEPSGTKKGGEFGYAIDRDAPLKSSTDNTIYAPDYRVTRDLIQIMNPAH